MDMDHELIFACDDAFFDTKDLNLLNVLKFALKQVPEATYDDLVGAIRRCLDHPEEFFELEQ